MAMATATSMARPLRCWAAVASAIEQACHIFQLEWSQRSLRLGCRRYRCQHCCLLRPVIALQLLLAVLFMSPLPSDRSVPLCMSAHVTAPTPAPAPALVLVLVLALAPFVPLLVCCFINTFQISYEVVHCRMHRTRTDIVIFTVAFIVAVASVDVASVWLCIVYDTEAVVVVVAAVSVPPAAAFSFRTAIIGPERGVINTNTITIADAIAKVRIIVIAAIAVAVVV